MHRERIPMLRTLLKSAKTTFYETFAAVKRELPSNKSVISFTFDDAPSTSLRGAEILERYGFLGTYYLCGMMANLTEKQGRRNFIGVADAKALLKSGHQIGCHTYNHVTLSHMPASDYAADAARNRDFWQDALGTPLLDFSYPLGEVTLPGKRALSGHYQSLRGIRGGVNRGSIDMSCLRAVSISNGTFNREKIQNLITDCATNGGWLIFFSHGIDDPESQIFDTKSADFSWAVDCGRASGASVLSIEQARKFLLDDNIHHG